MKRTNKKFQTEVEATLEAVQAYVELAGHDYEPIMYHRKANNQHVVTITKKKGTPWQKLPPNDCTLITRYEVRDEITLNFIFEYEQ